MRSRPLILAIAVLSLTAALALLAPLPAHAEPDAPAGPPNILWLSTEDMSPALGAYGDAYATTPTLDRLARDGVLYTRAYVPAPICAPARSSIITGTYATALGTQHLRSNVPIPDAIRTLPELLRAHGYYATNNAKTDYNFSPEGLWDELGRDAHWRGRPEGAPFFSVFNFTTTHEGPTNHDDREEERLGALPARHDPAEAVLPPHLPDTPEMRRIWARAYDLVTVMDAEAAEVLEQLAVDGLNENTIVFFWSDHGWGLPGYKRWNYSTGLHVPLIVYAPPQYRHLLGGLAPGQRTDRLVSLVDLAPTVLSLVGVEAPAYMDGLPFLGPHETPPRDYVFGARDRADDVYDVSRAAIDDRFIYVRNYLPHRPYIQRATIFGDEKASYRELNRLRAAGALPPAARRLYEPRPREELYDLAADPHELNNLADDAAYRPVLERMRTRLRAWILETRDTGFLHETEMALRAEAAGMTVYEMARDPEHYDLPRILAAAERVGDPAVPADTLHELLESEDAAVRYWAVVALQARGDASPATLEALEATLTGANPSVAVAAAETLCAAGRCERALPVLARHLAGEDRLQAALHAARAIANLGPRAAPLLPELRAARQAHSGDAGRGGYRDWLYSMFIGFAVDQALADLQP